jgi:hypothetical protein
MSNTAENPRSEQELDAREALMREQFQRQNDSWEKAIPLASILRKLKAKISPKK